MTEITRRLPEPAGAAPRAETPGKDATPAPGGGVEDVMVTEEQIETAVDVYEKVTRETGGDLETYGYMAHHAAMRAAIEAAEAVRWQPINSREQSVIDDVLAWMREGARLEIFWQKPCGAEGSLIVTSESTLLPPRQEGDAGRGWMLEVEGVPGIVGESAISQQGATRGAYDRAMAAGRAFAKRFRRTMAALAIKPIAEMQIEAAAKAIDPEAFDDLRERDPGMSAQYAWRATAGRRENARMKARAALEAASGAECVVK